MKIAIVGCAPRTKYNAPFDESEWEIWALGNQIDKHKRISRIFEIHNDLSMHPETYPEFLASKEIPMIVGDQFPIKRDHIKQFPLEKVRKLMDDHLTSSVAYMMAMAILENAKEISLYGIEMDVDDSEYFYQRPALYAWKGFAESKGIKVNAPGSSLFKDRHYPDWNKRDLSGPFTQKGFLRMAERHQLKINDAYANINQLKKVIEANSGCKQVYERLAKIARATDDGIDVQSIEDSTEIK